MGGLSGVQQMLLADAVQGGLDRGQQQGIPLGQLLVQEALEAGKITAGCSRGQQ